MKLQAECDNRRVVRLSVRRALLAAAAAVAATQSPASFAAAPAADSELEEVVVTGSILRRTDAESPSPVTVLSSETLEERGINTVAEAVQRLTANNAGTITKGWNTGFNFASGATAPALRGLTVQSTLSISDGLRMAPYPLADDGQRNFVDLSSIPSAIIDRVEVLRDGASSTYGADAIAGVGQRHHQEADPGFHCRRLVWRQPAWRCRRNARLADLGHGRPGLRRLQLLCER
jgi:outer membrane receptor protein involved in Fe transport